MRFDLEEAMDSVGLGWAYDAGEAVVDTVNDYVVDPIADGISGAYDAASEWVTDNIIQPIEGGYNASSITGMKGGSSAGIDDMTIGISKSGMDNFRDELKAKVLTETINVINDYKDMQDAINAGWQGASRDVWMKKFNAMREEIASDLTKEYYDLVHRLDELEDNYFAQDSKMIDLI